MEPRKRYLDGMTGRGPFLEQEGAGRPNVLLISMDMVPVDFYDPAPGFPEVKAPNLASLRDEHLFFDRAFTTSPPRTRSTSGVLQK